MYDLQNYADELAQLEQEGLFRSLHAQPGVGGKLESGGREILNFASNDYLDLANDHRLKEAAQKAIDEFGCGATSSRLIAGHLDLHAELEHWLAAFMGAEAALVFPSGYQSNVAAISTLANKGDTIFSDELNHASIVDGCRLSGAHIVIYRHMDVEHLSDLLSAVTSPGKKIIVSDAVFSMDGDLAPVTHLSELAQEHNAMLVIDEAHAVGLMGQGRGLCRERGVEADVVLGTLSKSLGTAGGFIATSDTVRNYLVNTARPFIFSTGLAPACAASALAAVNILDSTPDVGKELIVRATRLRGMLQDGGFDIPHDRSQIIPIVIGDNATTVEMAQRLEDQGILVAAVRPPSVPVDTARLRISVTLAHMEAEFQRAADALIEAGVATGVLRPSKSAER